MGLCNWLREYVPRFAVLAHPLTSLLSPKKKFTWTPAANDAFRSIKTALTKPLQLERPNFELPFILQTDASKISAAAVLYQIHKDGRKAVIAYGSTTFNPAEQKLHSNEQECLAVIWAVKKYRPYREDRHFTLRTDNKALTWLNSMQNQKTKLARWALLLQEFVFDVEHCPGRENELPDALSRRPLENEPEDLEDLTRAEIPYPCKPTTSS